MNEMANSKNGDSHELRTAGGESSEIVRTPDINLALYANADDMYRHRMTIMSVPSRLCEPFKNIEIYADLGPCGPVSPFGPCGPMAPVSPFSPFSAANCSTVKSE